MNTMSKRKKLTRKDETHTKIYWYYLYLKRRFKEINGEEASKNISNKFFYIKVADVFGYDWRTIDTIIRNFSSSPPIDKDAFVIIMINPGEL